LPPDAAERKELTQLIRADLREQGRLASETHTVSVLVEQDLSNPRRAASYTVGDEIHYRLGSPGIEGIPHNSEATIVGVDLKRNILTIETEDGERIAYSPAQLKEQTKQSTVYRFEERDLATGERVQFTASDRDNQLRQGDFATVERIAPDSSVSLRLDSGKVIELDSDKATTSSTDTRWKGRSA
jgi:hypothetical protein